MIRKMTSEDIEEVAGIEKSIFSKPWSEKSFRDALASEDTIYLAAYSKARIIGYCGIWISFDTADLCNMAVLPEYRKKGVADRLLQEAVSLVSQKAVKRIVLEVRESNEAAIRLYQKHNFKKIGVRKGYYTAPKEDAVLMECSLSQ